MDVVVVDDDDEYDDDESVGTIIEHRSSHGIDRFKPDSCVIVRLVLVM